MTEPTASGHLDLDALADLDQDITAEPLATEMRRHLAECAECTRRQTRIRTTRALLSTLPAEPVPDAVAARLDAALARATETTPSLVPLRRRRQWWRSPALAGSAAAAAVVLLVAGLVIGNLTGRHHSGASGAAGNGAQSAPNSLGGAAAPTTVKEWQTGTNYTPATIERLVPRLLTGIPSGREALSLPSGAAPGATPTASSTKANTVGGVPVVTIAEMRASRAAVVECGRILAAGDTQEPLAVDFAKFEGKPAVVVVLPTAGRASSVDVWVVRSICSDQAFDLVFHRMPRSS